mmetsp:Transcript_26065/g.52816  ORF Transcript_26065/g.52816 Transcript_26065/m.52816 type:complete len:228 (-) Transcript_26065:879-1562(-)
MHLPTFLPAAQASMRQRYRQSFLPQWQVPYPAVFRLLHLPSRLAPTHRLSQSPSRPNPQTNYFARKMPWNVPTVASWAVIQPMIATSCPVPTRKGKAPTRHRKALHPQHPHPPPTYPSGLPIDWLSAAPIPSHRMTLDRSHPLRPPAMFVWQRPNVPITVPDAVGGRSLSFASIRLNTGAIRRLNSGVSKICKRRNEDFALHYSRRKEKRNEALITDNRITTTNSSN